MEDTGVEITDLLTSANKTSLNIMLEVTVEIINSVVEVTIDLPYVGLTVSGIKMRVMDIQII